MASKSAVVRGGVALVALVAVGAGVWTVRARTPEKPKARVALKVGHLPVTGHAKFFVAKEEKFFEQEGLDVTLVEFTNSADGLSALRSHQLDLGAFGTTAPLVHIAKGADLRIIGGVMGEDASIITTKEKAAEIKSVADLRGRKVATVRLATGDAVLRGALAKVNLDWRKDLQIFEVKNPPAVIESVKLLGAAAALYDHRYALAFPSFGPERRGAPVLAFTRIDEQPVSDRSPVRACDWVVVLDDTLMSPAVVRGLRAGALLVNTSRPAEQSCSTWTASC